MGKSINHEPDQRLTGQLGVYPHLHQGVNPAVKGRKKGPPPNQRLCLKPPRKPPKKPFNAVVQENSAGNHGFLDVFRLPANLPSNSWDLTENLQQIGA